MHLQIWSFTVEINRSISSNLFNPYSFPWEMLSILFITIIEPLLEQTFRVCLAQFSNETSNSVLSH